MSFSHLFDIGYQVTFLAFTLLNTSSVLLKSTFRTIILFSILLFHYGSLLLFRNTFLSFIFFSTLNKLSEIHFTHIKNQNFLFATSSF